MMPEDGKFREEDGNIIYDLRSQDLCDLTPLHLKNLLSGPISNGDVFTHVSSFLLDYNDIQEIPKSIGDCTSLKRLSVIGNQLCSLPESIGSLVNLEVLNVNENEISCFPSTMGNLKSLQILSAVANKLYSIEEGIFPGLKSLREMYLDENLLVKLPKDIKSLDNLEKFECSENEIANLPDGFGNLKQLAILNFDSNRLKELPSDFCELPNLEILLLSNNNLSVLPDKFLSAKRLKKLILSKNDLPGLPKWFDDLVSIQELDVEDNEILAKPFTKEFCTSASQISSLSAGRNYISSLPEEIGMLSTLKHLHLGSTMLELERSNFQSGNWLTNLPEGFPLLVNLEKLHLDENQIKSLPEDFGQLSKLHWLDLGQNQLEHLPVSFSQLTSLTYLQLSKNRLKSLPKEIGNLEQLVELRLDSNRLSEIPDSISKLRVLHSLDLFNNCLKEFPRAVMSLSNLQRLDIEGNQFSTQNMPKMIKENVYPVRDEALKDNWRGKTRADKIKCEVIEVPSLDTENGIIEEEEVVCFNESALIRAMRAGMSLWKHHEGPDKREADLVTDRSEEKIEPQGIPEYAEQIAPKVDLQDLQVIAEMSKEILEEDWDEELKDENYQDTLDTYNSRKFMNSVLIDDFQNNINRYPPCVHAYSQSACYDSLVYKNSQLQKGQLVQYINHVDGQFDDAEE